jgi:hypothetical protein
VPLEPDLKQSGADGLLLVGGCGGAGPSAAFAREEQLGELLPGAWLRIALGSRPLLLLAHGDQLPGRGSSGGGQPRFLLPACGSAVLADQLKQLAWLELEHEQDSSAEALIGRLAHGRLLLPAAGSLLDHSPWREAGLVAVPPPEVLLEELELWIPPEQAKDEAIGALTALLRQRLAGGCQQKTPAMGGGSPERP